MKRVKQRFNLLRNKLFHSFSLVIVEVHTLIEAGAAGGAIQPANLLNLALTTGELEWISATTLKEYHKHMEEIAALKRRFQPVLVDKPCVSNYQKRFFNIE